MTIGSPLDERAFPLNVKRQWREWSGRFASSAYAAHHDIEVNAIRNAAALMDLSALYKYRVAGPDAQRLVDRVITRDATKLEPGQVFYTPWCDEHGKVLDDGTIHRLDDDSYRWTAADPQLRWLRLNARGLDVTITEDTDTLATLGLQGPLSRDVLEAATGGSFADLRYFRRREGRVGDLTVDVSRTGYTGDLGYELWVDATEAVRLWDALMEAGRAFGDPRQPGCWRSTSCASKRGSSCSRWTTPRRRTRWSPSRAIPPTSWGSGGWWTSTRRPRSWAVRRYVGSRPRVARRAGWSAWTSTGPTSSGCTPRRSCHRRCQPRHGASTIPVYAADRQVGRATSGTWSPGLKRNIALASVEARYEPPGTLLEMEWTVEGRRGRVSATVTELPFFDPPHKRA